MNARALVLARIGEALTDVPDDETPDSAPVPRAYSTVAPEVPDPVALFVARVADYGATVILTTEDRARQTIATTLSERGIAALVVPEGFPADLLPEATGIRLGDAPRLSVEALDAADGVLTTAAVGIAVTGTIVLDAGPGQGRRALTLLPDYHLCVLREEQIAGDVPAALARLDPTAPLTFISGPSATSDIELDRVEGVHGPRTLDVIVVAASPSYATEEAP
ncbi:LutC/YkgG family protein [Streptomyces lavendulocolor]|uniref:LutC/YkgG family protein n=1 Tax=Streptomyces lavendulocolor TaxID=67316 RepID=UPI003C2D1C97